MSIRPLHLGNKIFPVNIIQGPLAGVSCAPFRRLTWRYSQPAFSYTEMISCKTILHSPSTTTQRFIKKDSQEGPVCFQLASCDPIELAETTKKITDVGADLIDLNCGCPVKKIRSKGAGSRLLTSPSKLYQLIRAMKQNTHVPVSVKIRVQGQSTENFNQEIANVIQEAGADYVVVHGRHWSEHYETPCRYDDIEFFVKNLSIPVIGNGDVACITSLKKMFATGCAGVMVARAGVGQPWLIGNLLAEQLRQPVFLPSATEIGTLFIEHIQELACLLKSDKHAVLQARKLAKYYARSLSTKTAFISSMNNCEDLSTFIVLCHEHFTPY